MNGATQDKRKTNVQKLPNAQIQGSGQVFKGIGGNRYAEALAGKVLIGRSWSLAIYGKGRHHRVFLDSRSSDSERVPVFSFQLCPSPLVLWGRWRGGTLVPDVAGGQSFLFCASFRCTTCGFGQLSLKSNSVSR